MQEWSFVKRIFYRKKSFVPIDVIPKKIISAFLSAEDKDFYDHIGVDIQAITRALIQILKIMGKEKD